MTMIRASLRRLLLFAALTAHADPVPDAVREQFALAPFYKQCVLVGGLPIVGSAKVSEAALAEAAWLAQRMTAQRPEILQALADAKVRFAIMAHDEYTTDIPEHAHLKPRVYWDRRARGLGATPRAPAVSGGEENLLAFPGDPYPRENIPLHEFAHAIHEMAMKTIDPTFDERLRKSYDAAMAAGLWKNTYAAVNRHEYWAEATQAWFDNNDANNALHNDISTRAKLKEYDPGIAALCAEVFGDLPWRYQKPADRRPEDRAHLAGYDPAKAPRFRWRQEPVPDRPRVTLHCAEGEIELELAGPRDDLGRLLAQIQEGYYSGGRTEFAADGFKLTPAASTPDGASIPEGEGRWTLRSSRREEAPSSSKILIATVVKGGALATQLAREAAAEGVRVQRIVRLN